ncbi:MAG: response regulator transcription factor [Epsilonproteobacteria bacterium]|nr:response regulator transcription factor [Campylobacterota bacterium]
MLIQDVIAKSKLVLVEGDKKIGKLAFSLMNAEKGGILVISSYPRKLLEKRIASLENLDSPEINEALRHLDFLTLKEEWQRLKAKYGFDFITRDIEHAIETYRPKTIICHRFDTVFSNVDIEASTLFMERMINIKEANDFKLFFTVSTDEHNSNAIGIIEDYSDIHVSITKSPERTVEVKTSIFPIETERFRFVQNGGQKLRLIPIESEEEAEKTAQAQEKTERDTEVLLISENEELIKFHRYLFERRGFKLTVAHSMPEMLDGFLTSPDLIIFNLNSDQPDFDLCHTLKERNIKSKMIYIVQSPYVRYEDKMRTIESGCFEILPSTFNCAEYVLEIEKTLQKNFYTPTSNKITSHRVFQDKGYFCDIVDAYYNDKIFFSIIKFRSNIVPHDMRKMLRNQDLIYFDPVSRSYVIALINMRKNNTKVVLDKLAVEEGYTISEAFDWPKVRADICD